MKIDISRSYSVAALRDLIAGADDAAQIEFTRTLKKDQIGTCWCGCGATTKSRFAPGHDSKFHSLAKQVARGQAEMPESFVNDEAKADFLAHVEAERPLWAVKQEALAQIKAAKPVKVKAATKVEAEDNEALAALLAKVTMS